MGCSSLADRTIPANSKHYLRPPICASIPTDLGEAVRSTAQKALLDLYASWKSELRLPEEEAESLSPPLLLDLRDDYCHAEKRVLFLGQETRGYGANNRLQDEYPDYPNLYPYLDMNSCRDFLMNDDAIEALCWMYREFNFCTYQPKDRNKSPLWRAFDKVRSWPGVGIMWDEVVRMDYLGGSIQNAPRLLQEMLIPQQANLLAKEVAVLNPDIALFFSGPNYDQYITASFPGCSFVACGERNVREVAQIIHPDLPTCSFRTYHPNYLFYGRWGYIDELRELIYQQ